MVHLWSTIVCNLFVCVEVLRPSQPNGVMSSAVSLIRCPTMWDIIFHNYMCSIIKNVYTFGRAPSGDSKQPAHSLGAFCVAKDVKFLHVITKTRLHNFLPSLTPLLYSKTGFYRVYIIFLIFAQKHWVWYSLEPLRRGGSNEFPQSMFWAEI